MTNYNIGNFITRLKNALMAGRDSVTLSSTKLALSVAKTLKKGGYLETVENKKGELTVTFAKRKKKPVMIDLKIVSRPGLRRYITVDELSRRRSGSSLVISTNKGMMMEEEAKKKGVGGEIIAEIT